MIRALLFGLVVQFTSYFNLVINYRAVAHNQILFAMITDGLAVVITIFIVKRLAGAKEPWTAEQTGMVIGGSLAAWAGITLTRAWG